jgi:hypothetical protein
VAGFAVIDALKEADWVIVTDPVVTQLFVSVTVISYVPALTLLIVLPKLGGEVDHSYWKGPVPPVTTAVALAGCPEQVAFCEVMATANGAGCKISI